MDKQESPAPVAVGGDMDAAEDRVALSARAAFGIGFVVLAQPMGALQIAGTLCVVGASIGAVVQK